MKTTTTATAMFYGHNELTTTSKLFEPVTTAADGNLVIWYLDKLSEDVRQEDKVMLGDQAVLHFALLASHKIRCRYRDVQRPEMGMDYFCWDTRKDRDAFPKGAKCQYLLAGVLTDPKGKVLQDPNNPENAAFVYFRCKGTKYISAQKVMSDVGRAFACPPVSVPNARVHIRVTPGKVDTRYGPKNVFDFELLPKPVSIDPSELQIAGNPIDPYDAFVGQFDKSDWYDSQTDDPTFSEDSKTPEPESQDAESDYPESDFELNI